MQLRSGFGCGVVCLRKGATASLRSTKSRPACSARTNPKTKTRSVEPRRKQPEVSKKDQSARTGEVDEGVGSLARRQQQLIQNPA